MTTKNSKPAKKLSNAALGIAIYQKHLRLVEEGRHSTTRSWRQSVLEEFARSIDAAPAYLSVMFHNCQKKVGLRVNSDFEIERVGPAAAATALTLVPVTAAPAGAPLAQAIAVTQPVAGVPATGATSRPTAAAKAKAKAEKVYADLIALSEDEIKEAFETLDALIDDVDRLGDAKTLRQFTRQIRGACKRIEDQLATKAMLDKKQAQTILPGLQKSP